MEIEAVWAALREVMDPEIPVISVVDLGVIREVLVEDGAVTVAMTPTFAGCPALEVMRADIARRLGRLGAERVDVQVVLTPPWNTDMLSDLGRARLKEFGLAPPRQHGGLIQLILIEEAVCPYCGSNDTRLKNSFGSTPCRAIYTCSRCRQPFEQFKAL